MRLFIIIYHQRNTASFPPQNDINVLSTDIWFVKKATGKQVLNMRDI